MITGIIMACGFSKRMNRNKLMLNIDGEPIIEKVIKAAKNSNIDKILLIYREKEIKELGIKYGVETVFNSKAQCGQSESMKLGIIHSPIETNGFMFFVGDQPFIDSNTINTLIESYKEEDCLIVVPRYNGKNGNPTIFSVKLKEKLLMINGDEGGKSVIKNNIKNVKYVNINNSMIGNDIDTWDEYIKWR